MERVLSTEERIKRAEEVYRNKQQGIHLNKRESKNKISKYKIKLLKKMLVQILICLAIYSLFYYSKNSEELFSKDLVNKTKEILGYDINFKELYNNFTNWFSSQNVFATEENQNVIDNNIENIIQNEISENIGGASEESKEVTNLSQMEIDANDIKSKYTLIKPLQGTITSRYGHREPTTKTVPKEHTGIDIAANVGTVIYAALDGTVKIASSEGDYGKHLRIEKDDVAIYYAHCNKLYVKEGDYVKQNEPIAEVGATGNVTGPHLHFEIRKNERYVDPDMVLKF